MKGVIGRNVKEAMVIRKIRKSGNGHVFYYWNKLDDPEKDNLMSNITDLNLRKIKKMYSSIDGNEKEIDYSNYESADAIQTNELTTDIKQAGVKALKLGEVAFLTVAGGQASRLGYDKPKGCFDISPIKQKSLFQIFAEKIYFYSKEYNVEFKWLIMTSEYNYMDTKAYFEGNSYFGLKPSNIIFFKQGMLPTLTTKGHLILKEKGELFLNPDGHGGILKALLKIGLVDRLIKHGIKYLSYFQVDNPLINMADPAFIGYHILNNSEVTTKVIKKSFPEEKLGTIAYDPKRKVNQIIEYSDIPDDLMYRKKESGELDFLMGSIGVHVFSTSFIKKTTKKLPIHVARKEVKGISFEDFKPVENDSIDAIKFETFVFDTIPLSKNSFFFETLRKEEFFPLKNKTGNDSIETCINGQKDLYASWIKDAGFDIKDFNNCEISPLFAPDRDFFLQRASDYADKIKDAIYNSTGSVKNEIYIE